MLSRACNRVAIGVFDHSLAGWCSRGQECLPGAKLLSSSRFGIFIPAVFRASRSRTKARHLFSVTNSR